MARAPSSRGNDATRPPARSPSAKAGHGKRNAAQVVAASIRTHWRRTRDELMKVCGPRLDEHVHDLRVALRRLLSALEIAECLDVRLPAKTQKSLERLLRSLSPLRDLEVQKQTLERLGEDHPELLPVAERLAQRRAALARRLAQKLDDFAPELVERALDHGAQQLEAETSVPEVARILVLAAIVRRYTKFDRRRRAVAGDDRHALHAVRVAFKKYRYAVEVALPLLPREAERALSAMKLFQDELGAIQDAGVLIDTLSGVKPSHRGPNPTQALLGALKQAQRRRIEATTIALGAQVTAVPPAFSEIFG
ncbi:MAG TPA: CHAD domain-containing protein [Polyangiaceae bacterium]|nr:CHAD domain-containing protein [Polyangiaceae bacterium]